MSWTCTYSPCQYRDNVAGAKFCRMCGYAQKRREGRDDDSFRNSLFDGITPWAEHRKWVPRKDRLDPLYMLTGNSFYPNTRYWIGGQSFIVSGRVSRVANLLAAGIAIVQPGQAFNPNELNFRLWSDNEQYTILQMFHAAGVCIARVQTVAGFHDYVLYRSTTSGIAILRFLVEIGSLNPFATQYPWNIKGATHFNGNALVDVRERFGSWHTAVIVDKMIRYLVFDREEQVDGNPETAPPFTKSFGESGKTKRKSFGFPFPYGTCICDVAANYPDGGWLYRTLQDGVATWRQKLRRCRHDVAVIGEIPKGIRNLIVGYMIGGWAEGGCAPRIVSIV